MEHWVSLEVSSAYGLSIHDGTIAAACANGLVRLFRAADLRYIATLPRPPPLGRANISSVRELQELTDALADAVPADMAVTEQGGGAKEKEEEEEEEKGGIKSPPLSPGAVCSSSAENVSSISAHEANAADAACGDLGSIASCVSGVTGSIAARDHESGGGGGGSKRSKVTTGTPGPGLQYPAVLGCRLSPTGTKVVCVYADRGLFIWDITDPLCVGKYRSFLAHAGCIWDVQRMPGEGKRDTLSGAGA